MNIAKIIATLCLTCLATPVLPASTPTGGPLDIRIRMATYNENQVYSIETDLRHATTIHFGRGERFEAVIVGDTESFQVDPIPELGNVLTIKPHISGASTNMTVITNRRRYSFHLREGRIAGRTGMFFEVRFRYPDDERKPSSPARPKGYGVPKNYAYLFSGTGDFRPSSVYDDGRFTYFTFAKNARQPALFKADNQGRERTVNWTQQGNTVRVFGVTKYWTLRIGDEAICIYRNDNALTVGN